jgi:hypothetical protein
MSVKINRTHFEPIDFETLLSRRQRRYFSDYQSYQWVGEFPCGVLEIDGKLALAFGHSQLCDPQYEEIIRLTYVHYLGRDQESYSLYEYDFFNMRRINLLTAMEIHGEVTPQTVLDAALKAHPDAYKSLSKLLYKPNGSAYISRYRQIIARIKAASKAHPDAYNLLSKLLYKEPNGSAFISHYRQFIAGIDDIVSPYTVQRVILYSDFSTSPFDLV